jgi:hypothetical protein
MPMMKSSVVSRGHGLGELPQMPQGEAYPKRAVGLALTLRITGPCVISAEAPFDREFPFPQSSPAIRII